MKEEAKQRMFHQTLLQRLYPPPPNEDQEQVPELIDISICLPEAELEVEGAYSSPSSRDEEEGENKGVEKLSRAQRKRKRKKNLSEAASNRRKIIGPLLPGSTDIHGNDDHSGVQGVRQNANTATDISGGRQCCTKQNKIKRRRMSKKLAGKNAGMEMGTGNQ